MTDSTQNTKLSRPAFLVETKSLRDLMADLRKAELWLLVAAIAAFLASAFFVVKYFVGGEMTPTLWTTEQWMNAFLGLGITAVITAAQAFLYASGYKGHAAILATFIVVFFGLFSEISQSMEREDATVKHRSENSPVFQAALGSIQNLSQQAAIPVGSTALAAAQGKLARHEAELVACAGKYRSDSRIRRCEKYELAKIAEAKGELASAQAAATASTTAASSALSTAITQAKSLQYDEDQHYAMIRLIKGFLGVTGIWASFLFSVIIIGTFEYAFHFVGSYVADHKKALLLLGRDAHGTLIKAANTVPPEAAQETGTIPEDYGNPARKDYLDWVSPERENHQGQAATSQTAPEQTEAQAQTQTEPAPTKNVHDLSHKRFFQLLYTEIRTKILNGEVRPTVRPVTNAVTDIIKHKSEKLGVKPSLMGKPQRQKIAETILMKLELETVVERNQDGGIGKPKYVLAHRYQQRLKGQENGELPNIA